MAANSKNEQCIPESYEPLVSTKGTEGIPSDSQAQRGNIDSLSVRNSSDADDACKTLLDNNASDAKHVLLHYENINTDSSETDTNCVQCTSRVKSEYERSQSALDVKICQSEELPILMPAAEPKSVQILLTEHSPLSIVSDTLESEEPDANIQLSDRGLRNTMLPCSQHFNLTSKEPKLCDIGKEHTSIDSNSQSIKQKSSETNLNKCISRNNKKDLNCAIDGYDSSDNENSIDESINLASSIEQIQKTNILRNINIAKKVNKYKTEIAHCSTSVDEACVSDQTLYCESSSGSNCSNSHSPALSDEESSRTDQDEMYVNEGINEIAIADSNLLEEYPEFYEPTPDVSFDEADEERSRREDENEQAEINETDEESPFERPVVLKRHTSFQRELADAIVRLAPLGELEVTVSIFIE